MADVPDVADVTEAKFKFFEYVAMRRIFEGFWGQEGRVCFAYSGGSRHFGISDLEVSDNGLTFRIPGLLGESCKKRNAHRGHSIIRIDKSYGGRCHSPLRNPADVPLRTPR